jgi:hypothetical protein
MKKSPARKFKFVLSVLVTLLIAYNLLLKAVVYADTHMASSLSSADVQSAINAASNGDIVQMPAGTATWTTGVNITNKGITLQGAGMTQTVIVDNTGTAFPPTATSDPVTISNNTDNFLRITGFTLDGTGSVTAGYTGGITFIGDTKCFRIDNIKFLNECSSVYNSDVDIQGLMDHCTAYVTDGILKTGDIGGMFPIERFWWINPAYFPDAPAEWEQRWKRPLALGTSNAFYIEDCYFNVDGRTATSSAMVLSFNGDRIVVRHNTIYGPVNGLENYWCGYSPYNRGSSSVEIYNNTYNFVREGNKYCYMYRFDSGTGVVFDNTFTTAYGGWHTFFFENNRAWTALNPGDMYNGKCDGTSPIDGNTPVESGTHTGSNGAAVLTCSGKNWTSNQWVGYAVRNLTDTNTPTQFYTPCAAGLITANTANTITATLTQGTRNNWNTGDNFIITDGYPCLDQLGRGPGPIGNQSSQPLYEWNNTLNGTVYHIVPRNAGSVPDTKHVKQNRDYYNCTDYSDAISKGLVYTPYTYPHPLQFAGGPPDTTPPADIATVNDGTGTDIDSIPQGAGLSANWSASSDPDGWISGYRYAIGTTPGGTNTVGWTSNAGTGVTRTDLSLTVGVTYYFSVKAVNGAGLESLSAASSDGQCVIGGGDGIPPLISNVRAVDITDTGATITWDTDEPATSRVQYGVTASYGNSTIEDSDLVTGHSVNLTDLISGIEYHYRVISKDSLSNEKISIDYKFTTSSEDKIDAKVYPSPYSSSEGNSIRFSVDRTTGGEVKIYTLSGNLVKELVIQSGESEVDWDVLNEDGNSITAGLYIYTITDGEGNKKTGKLAISH